MKKQVIEKLSALITAAFGLVAALAWNDAIKALFKEEGALEMFASFGPWAYALFVTVLAVFMTIWVGQMSDKTETKMDKKNNKTNNYFYKISYILI